jgi:pimeloyl-ACP methyl ester carboxylesterase
MQFRRTLALAVFVVVALVAVPAESATKKRPSKKPTTRRVATTVVAPTTTPQVPVSTVPQVPISTISWAPCAQYECGTVTVPQDYAIPAGSKIGIALQRTKATGTGATKSILLNPGGPSGSGIGFQESAQKLFNAAVRAEYHIVGFDPRGVGRSSPLPCGSTRDREARTGKDYIAAIKDACTNRAADLVKSITTANTARDMEEIRKALGEPKLNFHGISYGTYLGLVYADLFPDKVGRFIIDSAVDPKLRAIELTAGQYETYDATVLDFLRRCSSNRTCTFGPNSVARYDALLQQVGRQPIRFEDYVVSRPSLESITLSLIRRGQERLLAKVLTEFETKNGSSLLEVAALFDSALPDVNDLVSDPEGDAMYFQVACAEGFHPSSSVDSPEAKLALLTKNAPRFVASAASVAVSGVCLFWGQTNDSRPQPVAKAGVPPMLFVGSTFDSVTPVKWTRAVAAQWPGSVFMEIPGTAHGSVPSSKCADSAASEFLLTGKLPDPLRCALG